MRRSNYNEITSLPASTKLAYISSTVLKALSIIIYSQSILTCTANESIVLPMHNGHYDIVHSCNCS